MGGCCPGGENKKKNSSPLREGGLRALLSAWQREEQQIPHRGVGGSKPQFPHLLYFF